MTADPHDAAGSAIPASYDGEPICEGLLTTTSANPAEGAWRLSPMGPRVIGDFEELLLRPFRSSTTFRNLARHGRAAFHVTDDVDLIARAAIGKLDRLPACSTHALPDGDPRGVVHYLEDCCRRFAVEVVAVDDSSERTRVRCRVVDREDVRPFFGFSRAKFACLELAILVTRRHLYADDVLADEIARLETIVDKTAGAGERATFAMLKTAIAEPTRERSPELQ